MILYTAPMVGISHPSFRALMRRYHVPVTCYTEMISTHYLPREKVCVAAQLTSEEQQGIHSYRYQLLGNEPDLIAHALDRLLPNHPAGIDINMGCPAKKVLKHNWGVALMGDPQYARKVVATTVKLANGRVPVTVKLRAGFEHSFDYLRDFLQGLLDEGAAEITLHPRKASQGHRGIPDWDLYDRLQSSVAGPLVANGDIQCAEDIFTHAQRGVTRVMAARALCARPWMYWQWAYAHDASLPKPPLTPEEEGAACGEAWLWLLDDLANRLPEAEAVERIRFHVAQGCRWLTYGHVIWARLTKEQTVAGIQESLQQSFDRPQAMTLRTNLAR